MKNSLSKCQRNVISILKDGGKVFLFEDGSVGLDDKDMNTLPFYGQTFDALIRKKKIEVVERPSTGCEIYGATSLS